VWHLFVVRSKRRDALQKYLKSAGVQALIHYPVPPHLQEAYRDMCLSQGSFPVSEVIHREVLSLPIGPHVDDSGAERSIYLARTFFRCSE
jgi:dTDP-4-amino-4,6-dideoxygalactose transaminase